MFKYEYTIYVGNDTYEFFKENESNNILRRNMQFDILSFLKRKNIKQDTILVELTVLYDEEYYDSDTYELEISSNYDSIELKSA